MQGTGCSLYLHDSRDIFVGDEVDKVKLDWRNVGIHIVPITNFPNALFVGIIVAGPPGSGKSSVIQSLVDALCVSPRGMSRATSTRGGGARPSDPTDIADTNHKLQKLFPLVVDDLSLIFGHLNHNHDWVDGIFTSAWKKASRVSW